MIHDFTYITSHRGNPNDLKRCIYSVYQDTRRSGLKNYEHLVFIDGGNTVEYNNLQLPGVKIIGSGVNIGKAAAVNYMMSIAKGRVIFFLDSDDWNMSGRTETQLSYLDCADKHTMLGANFFYWNRKGLFEESNYPTDDKTIKSNFWRYPFMLYSLFRFQEIYTKKG